MVFLDRHWRVHDRLDRCALSQNVTHFVIARILQGMGGAIDDAGWAAGCCCARSTRAHIVNAMTWVTVPALIGPVIGPPLGGFITHLFLLALDLPDQHPDRAARHLHGDEVHRPDQERDPERFDLYGLVLAGIGLAGIAFGLSVAGLGLLPWPSSPASLRSQAISMTLYVMHARRTGSPVLDFSLLAAVDHARQHHRRLPVPPRHRRAAVPLPLLMQEGFGLTPFNRDW